MQPTRPWYLLGLAAVIALLTWLLVRATFASLPPLPWTAVPALTLLAAGEWLTGRNLRDRLRGRRPGKPVQPMAAPRHDAVAAAATLLASIVLIAGALYLERSCRAPEPPSDDDLPSANGQQRRRP